MRVQPPSQDELRLRKVGLVLGLILLAFVFKLLQFQVFQADEINKVSYNKRSVEDVVPAVRGSIVDAQGKILAKTELSYDINVDPSMVSAFNRMVNGVEVQISVDQAAQELATYLKVDVSEIKAKLAGTSRYANLKPAVDALTFTKIRALEIPWVFDKELQHRVYPNGALAGNLLGFMARKASRLKDLNFKRTSAWLVLMAKRPTKRVPRMASRFQTAPGFRCKPKTVAIWFLASTAIFSTTRSRL